jgi:hypothetical protein
VANTADDDFTFAGGVKDNVGIGLGVEPPDIGPFTGGTADGWKDGNEIDNFMKAGLNIARALRRTFFDLGENFVELFGGGSRVPYFKGHA